MRISILIHYLKAIPRKRDSNNKQKAHVNTLMNLKPFPISASICSYSSISLYPEAVGKHTENSQETLHIQKAMFSAVL